MLILDQDTFHVFLNQFHLILHFLYWNHITIYGSKSWNLTIFYRRMKFLDINYYSIINCGTSQ